MKHEDGADEREDASAETLAAGTFDEIKNEASCRLKEALPATRHHLGVARDGARHR